MSKEESFYPSVPSNKVEIPSTELENQFRKTIYRERVNEISMLQYRGKEKLTRYQKIKKRWTKANIVLKYSNLVVVLSSATAATVLTSLATAGISIPIIAVLSVTGVGLFQTSVLEFVIKRLTDKKQKEYRDKISYVQSYLDKMYLSFEKAREDGEISNEELEVIRKLSSEMMNIKSNSEEIPIEQLKQKIKEMEVLFANVNNEKRLASAPTESKISLF